MKKENVLTHKILPILSIFILCFFNLLISNTFAIEVSEEKYPDLDFLNRVTIDDNGYYSLNGNSTICTDYMILYSSQYNHYNVMFFNGNSFYLDVPRNFFHFTDYSEINYFNLEYDSNGAFFRVTNSGSKQSYFGGWWSKLYYSTCDILDAEGNIFFQKTPVKAVTIPALETVQEIPMVITTTLKLIIPIGLVIFGILLVILLVKSVIWQAI